MRLVTKIWLIVAASLVVTGGILFSSVMTVHGWDFTKLSTVQYETNEHDIEETYGHISVVTDTADVVFLPSADESTSVICYELEKVKHNVDVRDGTLVIEFVDTRRWYEHIGFYFGSPKITVYLPRGVYGALSVESDTGNVEIPGDFTFESMAISESTGDVTSYADVTGAMRIQTSTGNIRVEGVTTEAMSLSVTTGDVTASDVTCEGDVRIHVSTGDTRLNDITCRNLSSDGNTGDLSLQKVVAAGRLSLERSTGSVRLDGCDAAEISIVTETGDVTGTLLSEKVFIAKTDTGDIRVPSTTAGGRCEITTDTGNIRITIAE